jgi:hypothetical protein
MRGATTALAVGLVLLAGCGDSASSPLPAGAPATVDGADGAVSMFVRGDDAGGGAAGRDVRLPGGTRVVVVQDRPAHPGMSPGSRLVRVRVEQGEHKGLVGEVRRAKLRPAR